MTDAPVIDVVGAIEQMVEAGQRDRARAIAALKAGEAIYPIYLPEWLWDRMEAEGTTPEELVPLPSPLYAYAHHDKVCEPVVCNLPYGEAPFGPQQAPGPRNRAERRREARSRR